MARSWPTRDRTKPGFTRTWNHSPGFDPPLSEEGASLDQLWAACQSYAGTPYVFGGKDIARDGGLDCSGFVCQVFADIGINLGDPDYTSAQKIWDNAVDTGDDVRPGDIITFTQTYAPADPVTHIGIIRKSQPSGIMWDTHVPPGVGITDYRTDYWQGHYYGHRRVHDFAAPTVANSPWTAEQIAAATGAPADAVAENWPRIVTALQNVGAGSRASLAAAVATIAVETGTRFAPIHEYGSVNDWAGYDGGADYAGRGYTQLTHRYNYQAAGDALGVDLVNNPDLALDPDIAARIFAWYWQAHGIGSLADAGDWKAVRGSVVGNVPHPPGLDRLVSIVTALLP